jgi:hypothetical protein
MYVKAGAAGPRFTVQLETSASRQRRMCNPLDKGARVDASTAILGREGEYWLRSIGNVKIAVRDMASISTYARLAAIEHRGFERVLGPQSPVVVLNWLTAAA